MRRVTIGDTTKDKTASQNPWRAPERATMKASCPTLVLADHRSVYRKYGYPFKGFLPRSNEKRSRLFSICICRRLSSFCSVRSIRLLCASVGENRKLGQLLAAYRSLLTSNVGSRPTFPRQPASLLRGSTWKSLERGWGL